MLPIKKAAKSIAGHKVVFSKVQVFKFEKDRPGIMRIKESLNQDVASLLPYIPLIYHDWINNLAIKIVSAASGGVENMPCDEEEE